MDETVVNVGWHQFRCDEETNLRRFETVVIFSIIRSTNDAKSYPMPIQCFGMSLDLVNMTGIIASMEVNLALNDKIEVQ